MTISITDLYEILSAKIGKEEAKTIVTYIEEKVEKEVDQKTVHLATKEDIERVAKDVERGFKEQNQPRLNTFIVIVIMILGLYAAIFLNK